MSKNKPYFENVPRQAFENLPRHGTARDWNWLLPKSKSERLALAAAHEIDFAESIFRDIFVGPMVRAPRIRDFDLLLR